MVYFHIPRNRMVESEYIRRMETTEHLLDASKDINYWEFEVRPSPAWASPTCHHMFVAKCTKTGIENPWLINECQADENGEYEREHNRIIESFTQVLIEHNHLEMKCKQMALQDQTGIVLSDNDMNFDMLARDMLWRGDHSNSYSS